MPFKECCSEIDMKDDGRGWMNGHVGSYVSFLVNWRMNECDLRIVVIQFENHLCVPKNDLIHG